MHICISKLTIIGSDNSLLPGRCEAIIWTNAWIFLIGPFGTNFGEILIEIFIQENAIKMAIRKLASIFPWPQCVKELRNHKTLTHWGWVTHKCVSRLTITGSDNALSPGRHQAIIWTNAGILLIGPLGTNFSEILIGIQTFSFKKMHLKMSSAKWRPYVWASMS